jgi:hypothetical protein
MAWHSKPTRCTLQVFLTKYHEHLVPGLQGTLVPNLKTTAWGANDRFGAVKFDCCGHTLDIVLANLLIERGAINPPAPEPPPVPKEVREEVLSLLKGFED